MRWVALLAVVAAALAASQAGAAPQGNLRIFPGVGIGKIRLGMTEAQLLRTMGRPRAVVLRSGSFGLRTIEYEYGYAAYVVRLFGARDRLRVTSVATTLRRERTSKGIGRGSFEREVARVYPAVRCAQLGTWRSRGGAVTYVVSARRTCTLFAPNGRRTTFTSAPPSGPFLSPARWRETARVVEVAVANR